MHDYPLGHVSYFQMEISSSVTSQQNSFDSLRSGGGKKRE